MKQIVKPLLLAYCLVFIIAGCQTATKRQTSYENWQLKAIGTYKGVIFSSGVNCPGMTTISKNTNGDLIGEYDFIEKGTKVSGTLYDFQIFAPLKLKCKWRDIYGTGDLVMLFNEDITEFNGYWNLKGKNTKYPWNGLK